MFIEIFPNKWINLDTVNNIGIVNNNNLKILSEKKFKGYLIILYMNYGGIISKDDSKKGSDYIIYKDYYVLNDKGYQTETEAKDVLIKTLGIHLYDNRSNTQEH